MRLPRYLRTGIVGLGTAVVLAGCGAPLATPHSKAPAHPTPRTVVNKVVLPASAAIPAKARVSLEKSVPTLNSKIQQLDTELSQLQKLLGG
jgi:hypothetical protein